MRKALGIAGAACLLLVGCETSTDTRGGTESLVPATRIIALSPHLTELVFTAGAGDRLVGVVEHSDFPVEALALTRIGDSFRLDLEAVTGLAPDLVLAWSSGTPADVQRRLRDMGFRVVSLDAAGLDDIAGQIREIGALAGTSTVAEVEADRYSGRLAELRRRYRDARVVSVFYQISAQPLFTISGRHVISESIEVCGGSNVFADVDGLSPAVSLESVIVAEPEAIVSGIAGQTPDELRAQWHEWTSVPAVRTGSLFTVNPDLMHRQTTRILDAVDELCAHLERVRNQ